MLVSMDEIDFLIVKKELKPLIQFQVLKFLTSLHLL